MCYAPPVARLLARVRRDVTFRPRPPPPLPIRQGFIVDVTSRGLRVGTLMGACFLRFAKDLGYKAAYFNLVFASNGPSVALWEGLGFQRVATIPQAANLKGLPYLDSVSREGTVVKRVGLSMLGPPPFIVNGPPRRRYRRTATTSISRASQRTTVPPPSRQP